MSLPNLSAFLKALEAVKQDYTCGFCLEMCKNPVTLSKCFHLICAEHFESLKICPTCHESLDGCTIYTDDRLGTCIQSAMKLDEIFDPFKPKDVDASIAASSSSKVVKKHGKANEKAISEKKVKLPIPTAGPTNLDLEKKVTKTLSGKTNQTNKQGLNSSVMSTASSSKANKTLEKRNNKGETLLHISCRLGKVDKVEELLNQGATPNTKDNAGWTPLHEVVQNGRLDLVQLLLQHNALINVPGQSNETPLHEAIRYNFVDIAEELVKNGADLNARNCKGETPLQLSDSTTEEKLLNAAENIVQTQTANVTLISNIHSEIDFENIRAHCVSQYRTVHNRLKLLSKHHSNLHIESKFTKKVTHLIVDAEDDRVCTLSLDILQGIAYGVWIQSSEWVSKSTEEKLEPFENFEVAGIGTKDYCGPKNARFNKYKQLPGLFDGCHFYLHNFTAKYEISKTIVVTKAILTKLITDAGGIVLRRVPNPESIPESEKLVPYHAKKGGKLAICSHYIIFKDIYQPMYNMQHLKALPIGWLIECLEKYELCEPVVDNYL